MAGPAASPAPALDRPRARFLAIAKRPELGAVGGLIVVLLFFVATADPAMFTAAGFMNVLSPAAQLGILAVGAALLMIAGEFDLSIGSMVAFAGLVFAAILVVWQAPLAVAILITFAFAISIGALNAQIVLKTGLPSFIVTLALLFILRGLTLVGLKWATDGSTQLRGVREAVADSALLPLFSGDAFSGFFAALARDGWIASQADGNPVVPGIPVELLWFACVAAVGAFVLARTRFGNWILASGGDAQAARN
jgi:simple sugar transport system permease protein